MKLYIIIILYVISNVSIDKRAKVTARNAHYAQRHPAIFATLARQATVVLTKFGTLVLGVVVLIVLL